MERASLNKVSFGIEALDRLVADSIPNSALIQIWSKSSFVGKSTVCLSLARTLNESGVPVFYITDELLDDLWPSMGYRPGGYFKKHLFKVFTPRYLEDLIALLKDIDDVEAAVIIDGLTLFALRHPVGSCHTDEGIALLDKQEMDSYIEIMECLKSRCKQFGLPSLVSNCAGDSYQQGSYAYGSAPDFQPCIFRNSDFSIELRPEFVEGQRYPLIHFIMHRKPRFFGKETAGRLDCLSMYYVNPYTSTSVTMGSRVSFCNASCH